METKKPYLRNDIRWIRETEFKNVTPHMLDVFGFESEEDVMNYYFDHNTHRFVFKNPEYQDYYDFMIDKFFDFFKMPTGPKKLDGLAIWNKSHHPVFPDVKAEFPFQTVLNDYYICVKPENWRERWIDFIRRVVITHTGQIYILNHHGYYSLPIKELFKAFIETHQPERPW